MNTLERIQYHAAFAITGSWKGTNLMTDIFHQEAFNDINRTRSKLRTYGKRKTKIGIEKYLFCVPNIESRTTLKPYTSIKPRTND